MTALLEMTGVCAGYGGIAVVRDLDLRVDAGEIVALLGPNGAGKSTTLLAASGLLPALGGQVLVMGQPVPTDRPERVANRGVAHVLENRALFAQLTVGENLRVGLPRGVRDLGPALDLFPALSPLLRRRAGLLSGGEQQMLALARAFASRPRLVMIDEMSLGLAPIIVDQLMPIVGTLVEETGCGVLLVEQHVHVALGIAHRGYVLAHGELVLQGSSFELAHDPSLLASSYLGATALDQ